MLDLLYRIKDLFIETIKLPRPTFQQLFNFVFVHAVLTFLFLVLLLLLFGSGSGLIGFKTLNWFLPGLSVYAPDDLVWIACFSMWSIITLTCGGAVRQAWDNQWMENIREYKASLANTPANSGLIKILDKPDFIEHAKEWFSQQSVGYGFLDVLGYLLNTKLHRILFGSAVFGFAIYVYGFIISLVIFLISLIPRLVGFPETLGLVLAGCIANLPVILFAYQRYLNTRGWQDYSLSSLPQLYIEYEAIHHKHV